MGRVNSTSLLENDRGWDKDLTDQRAEGMNRLLEVTRKKQLLTLTSPSQYHLAKNLTDHHTCSISPCPKAENLEIAVDKPEEKECTGFEERERSWSLHTS